MVETSPRLSMGNYIGQGADFVRLNQPVADKFMGIADVRSSISIVGRRARIPGGKDTILEGRFYGLKADGDQWLVDIDDLNLANKVRADLKKGEVYEEKFSREMSGVVARGLRSILVKEKVLNSGNLDIAFVNGGVSAAFISAGLLRLGISLFDFPDAALSIKPIFTSLFINVLFNSGLRVAANLGDQFKGFSEFSTLDRLLPTSQEPFIRKLRVRSMLAPVMPVEQLAVGVVYVAANRKKLIKTA